MCCVCCEYAVNCVVCCIFVVILWLLLLLYWTACWIDKQIEKEKTTKKLHLFPVTVFCWITLKSSVGPHQYLFRPILCHLLISLNKITDSWIQQQHQQHQSDYLNYSHNKMVCFRINPEIYTNRTWCGNENKWDNPWNGTEIH